jgi:hypothetical protein
MDMHSEDYALGHAQILPSRSSAVWVRVIVLLGAFLMTIGALLALFDPSMLVGKGQEINGAARIFAGYLFSRNLAIAALLVCALLMRAQRALGTLMLLTAAIQLVDAVLDSYEQRWTIVPGVVVLAVAFLIAAGEVSGGPVWKMKFWRRL